MNNPTSDYKFLIDGKEHSIGISKLFNPLGGGCPTGKL